jgi:hypothetical protein
MAEPTQPITPSVTPTVPQGGNEPAPQKESVQFVAKTQAEMDEIIESRLKRDREAREKELGMSTKEAKAIIAARKKAEEDEKTALEKANEKAANMEKALKDRDLRDLKRTKVDSLIAEKKIKLPDGVSISDVLDMIHGDDENGITESAGKLTKFFPFNASMGTGSNPANGGKKGPTIDEQITEAEALAVKDPKMWNRVTQLKLEKQRQLFPNM